MCLETLNADGFRLKNCPVGFEPPPFHSEVFYKHFLGPLAACGAWFGRLKKHKETPNDDVNIVSFEAV